MLVNLNPKKNLHYECANCGEEIGYLQGRAEKQTGDKKLDNKWRKREWRHVSTWETKCDVVAQPSHKVIYAPSPRVQKERDKRLPEKDRRIKEAQEYIAKTPYPVPPNVKQTEHIDPDDPDLLIEY
jgi:hypothetical protein